jgi:hypothetical protein
MLLNTSFMKIKFSGVILVAVGTILFSCKKDNYKEPSSTLSGRIVYKGEAINVENYQVPYQLYQFGFGKVGSIDGSFTQDGTYSAVLFNGNYKLIVPNGQGPFKWKQLASGAPDSVAVTINGNQTLDLEVTPYYMIRTPAVTGGAGKVSATFKAEKIITDASAKNIERVTLYINKTQFVSGANNIGTANLSGAAIADPNNISLSVSVPNISPQAYVYARIGLKIEGVEDLIFSPVQKITY